MIIIKVKIKQSKNLEHWTRQKPLKRANHTEKWPYGPCNIARQNLRSLRKPLGERCSWAVWLLSVGWVGFVKGVTSVWQDCFPQWKDSGSFTQISVPSPLFKWVKLMSHLYLPFTHLRVEDTEGQAGRMKYRWNIGGTNSDMLECLALCGGTTVMFIAFCLWTQDLGTTNDSQHSALVWRMYRLQLPSVLSVCSCFLHFNLKQFGQHSIHLRLLPNWELPADSREDTKYSLSGVLRVGKNSPIGYTIPVGQPWKQTYK